MKQHKNGRYLAVALRKEGEYHQFLVHQLILLAFSGPRPEGMECRHLDGDGHNNRHTNLKYGTHQDNMNDMLEHGRTTKGERDSQAKLIEADVLEVVEMLRQGMVQTEIAKLKGVTQGTIGHIARGVTWGHITKGLLPERYEHWTQKPTAGESIEKMRNSLTGKQRSEEAKSKTSESLRQTWAKRKAEMNDQPPSSE